MPFPLLTQRLTIEPLALSDLATFVSYRQSPEIARYQGWDTNYSLTQATELIESQIGVVMPAPGEWLQLAIRNRFTGELIGDLALHALEDDDCAFEIGFSISLPHQRQGLAKEAAASLVSYLFTEIKAKKIIAQTDRRNAPSIALLQSLGFQMDPSKRLTEEFKGEEVTVDYYSQTSLPKLT